MNDDDYDDDDDDGDDDVARISHQQLFSLSN